MSVKVLFVCTGNTCRSPMAEAMWRSMGGDASSAGLSAVPFKRASGCAQAVMAERGLDLSAHRARRVDGSVLEAADVIVPMTAEHAAYIAREYPRVRDRIVCPEDIPDPFGGGEDDYRRCAERIEKMLLALGRILSCS